MLYTLKLMPIIYFKSIVLHPCSATLWIFWFEHSTFWVVITILQRICHAAPRPLKIKRTYIKTYIRKNTIWALSNVVVLIFWANSPFHWVNEGYSSYGTVIYDIGVCSKANISICVCLLLCHWRSQWKLLPNRTSRNEWKTVSMWY